MPGPPQPGQSFASARELLQRARAQAAEVIPPSRASSGVSGNVGLAVHAVSASTVLAAAAGAIQRLNAERAASESALVVKQSPEAGVRRRLPFGVEEAPAPGQPRAAGLSISLPEAKVTPEAERSARLGRAEVALDANLARLSAAESALQATLDFLSEDLPAAAAPGAPATGSGYLWDAQPQQRPAAPGAPPPSALPHAHAPPPSALPAAPGAPPPSALPHAHAPPPSALPHAHAPHHAPSSSSTLTAPHSARKNVSWRGEGTGAGLLQEVRYLDLAPGGRGVPLQEEAPPSYSPEHPQHGSSPSEGGGSASRVVWEAVLGEAVRGGGRPARGSACAPSARPARLATGSCSFRF